MRKLYRGENCSSIFLKALQKAQSKIQDHISNHTKELNMTATDEEEFIAAKKCWLCMEDLKEDKVRDHDHLTGKFRGAAHAVCNLRYSLPSKIPILFHNLKNFDSHIIVNALTAENVKKVQIIPSSIEKFLAFFLDNFIFLDSYAFLASSLDNLSQMITEEERNIYLRQIFAESDLLLVNRKGVLPYDYIDDFAKYNDKKLPPIEKFYNALKDCNISEAEYASAEEIWNHFKCSDLGDYQDIYVKIDVCLLAAVFENFRKMAISEFKLDPCHFFSAPGLSWNAMLKKSRVVLDLITDVDMLLMLEKGIRGGITSCSKRYAKANNPRLPDYNPSQTSNYIAYLDVNNLYGYALSQDLPISDFEWVKKPIDDILQQKDANFGYIVEVDLIYPEEIHDDHNDYPLAPDTMTITDGQLGRYQTEVLEILKEGGYTRPKVKKLIACFLPKQLCTSYRKFEVLS